MTWLAFRQYRIETLGTLVLGLLLAIGLVVFPAFASRLRVDMGVDACVPLTNTNVNCVELEQDFRARLGWIVWLPLLIVVLPALVASYVGAPLFAREFERRTNRLAWTQGVSRLRWAATKLALVLAAAVLAALAVAPLGGRSATFSGFLPLHAFAMFDLEGPAFVSYVVFGVALGAFLGALTRRILGGMLLALLVFGFVRGVVTAELRPQYQPPLSARYALIARFDEPDPIPANAWRLGAAAFDAEGRRIPDDRVRTLQEEYLRRQTLIVPGDIERFFAERGLVLRSLYQPAERYPLFQAIEAAVFFGLSALLVALTLWIVRARDA